MTYQEYLASQRPGYAGMTHMPYSGANAVGGINSAIAQYLRDVASGKIADQGMARYGNAVKQGIAGNYGLFGDVLGDAMGGGLLAKGIPGLFGITKSKGARNAISEIIDDAALPMDEASRMRRAREMGFDVDSAMFHGTADDVRAFDPAMFGSSTAAESGRAGVWAVDDPRTARSYAEHAARFAPVRKKLDEATEAEKVGDWDLYDKRILEAEELEKQIQEESLRGQNIMPVMVRGDLLERDMTGSEFMDVQNEIQDIIRQAKYDNFAGVRFKNLSDDAGLNNRPATHTLVFDPKNVRSKFAAFDPAKKNSADILASYATLGLLGGGVGSGLLQQDESY